MKSDDINLMQRYLDGDLPTEETTEVELRLKSDERLADLLVRLAQQDAGLVEWARSMSVAELNGPPEDEIESLTPRSQPWLTRRNGAWAAAAAVLVLLGWWMWSDRGVAPPVTPVATVHELAGDVEVTDAAGRTKAAAAGASVYAGQVLRVGDEESRVELRLADGGQMALSAGTTLRFPAHPNARKPMVLEHGAVRVETSPRDKQRPLLFATEHARITASATRFRLYREDHGSRVESEEGIVRLTRPGSESVVDVGEGSFVVAGEETAPMVPQPLPGSSCKLRHTLLRAGDNVAFARNNELVVMHHSSRGWSAWRTLDGALHAKAPGMGQWTSALALVGSDALLALGNNGVASTWRLGDAAATQTRLRDKHIRAGAISDDGRWLAQASKVGKHGEVALWQVDAATGSIAMRRSLEPSPSRVAVANDGSLAVSQWGGNILLFDGVSGEETAQFKLRSVPTPLALSGDARHVAAFANKDGLILFDRKRGSRSNLWPGQGARVNAVRFSTDGRILFAGLDDGTVRAWATDDARLLLVLETGHRHVNHVRLSDDRSLLATVGDSDCVKLWECGLH